jgi:hypothetical protein
MINYTYKIQPINLDDIVKYDKQKYNSNNHWIDDVRPENYDNVLSQTNTNKWIDLFKPGTKQIKIINQVWIEWLKKANEISCQTGKFTKLYEDEIEIIVGELNNMYPNVFDDGVGYFVRVNNVSLKYGQHKEGPYYSFRQIFESIVSSIKGHSPINNDTNELVIYFLDWVNINPKYEFRVFVFENKITAISQQNLYHLLFKECDNYPEKFEQDIKLKLDLVVNYFYHVMIHKIDWISNYTFDFAIVDGKPYFIELNCFGKEYASGSALFHWLLDENILYNRFETNNVIEFRYTK